MDIKKIAQDTIAAIEKGFYQAGENIISISSMVQQCVEGTRYFEPDRLSAIRDEVLAQPAPFDHTAFEVVNETTLQGAQRITTVQAYQCIGVLNFASAKHPGGGFLGGAQAQEESLARSSALYASLLGCPEFYHHHSAHHTLIYSDRMIYSPNCPVFRTDDGHWLEHPYQVDFLTSPAPNAGAIQKNEPESITQIEPTLRERAGKLLALAVYQGCDALILGAWGCGGFRNDPDVVASIFADYLKPGKPFWGRFRYILFSVLDHSTAGNTCAPFSRHFN